MNFKCRQIRKGVSLDCVVSQDKTLPKKIDEARLLQLVTLVRAGMETFADREELARGHLRLALKIAGQYAAHFQRDADDYVCEAMFGIAYAIDKAKEKLYSDNITGWIIINIHRFIMDFRRTNYVMKGSGCEMNDTILKRHYSRTNRSKSNVRDIRETLDALTDDEDERTILSMKESGYTFREIAVTMEKSLGTVCGMCQRLEARYNRQG